MAYLPLKSVSKRLIERFVQPSNRWRVVKTKWALVAEYCSCTSHRTDRLVQSGLSGVESDATKNHPSVCYIRKLAYPIRRGYGAEMLFPTWRIITKNQPLLLDISAITISKFTGWKFDVFFGCDSLIVHVTAIVFLTPRTRQCVSYRYFKVV